jgi:hypothetical protein
VEPGYFFVRTEGNTRSHKLKLVKAQCRLNCRLYSFSNRVINMWNKLSSEVVACSTTNGFKNKLDEYLVGQGNYKSLDFHPLIHWTFIAQWITLTYVDLLVIVTMTHHISAMLVATVVALIALADTLMFLYSACHQ